MMEMTMGKSKVIMGGKLLGSTVLYDKKRLKCPTIRHRSCRILLKITFNLFKHPQDLKL